MLGPLPRATRRWNHQQRLTQRDQLGNLRLTANLRPGPLWISPIELRPSGHRQIRNVTDVVHGQFVFRGQGVITRNNRDLPLGEEVLGVEPDEVIDGAMHQRHVGITAAKISGLLTDFTQHDIDTGGVRFENEA